jgi:hypothetical protein
MTYDNDNDMIYEIIEVRYILEQRKEKGNMNINLAFGVGVLGKSR